MKPNFRIPTRNIQTIIQHHSYDPEGSDTFHLRVYTADGLCLNLEGDSIQHCYEIALMIKDNAPPGTLRDLYPPRPRLLMGRPD